MAADIPFMEVTGRKDVQNGGRLILKMTTGFRLFSSLSKVKFYFFWLFTSNLSHFNSFKLPYKIRLLSFRSPLNKSRKSRKVSLTIHSKYRYFDSAVQRAEDRRQKFHSCRFPFAVNVMLNLTIVKYLHAARSPFLLYFG